MPRSLALASLACGLLLSTSALAESVHIRASASTRVSTDENGTVTRTEKTETTEEYSGRNGTSVQTRLSTGDSPAVRSTSSRSVKTGTSKGTAASAAVHITSGLKRMGNTNRVQMRLARRICTKLSSEQKEQCMEDAAEGTVSAVREKLRMWLGALNR